ncbi:MAG: redoxin domain-containing protein [Armatimonadetes bacterium]|nr:redoxin domain-containing protein [Armatimonadota bacterium]
MMRRAGWVWLVVAAFVPGVGLRAQTALPDPPSSLCMTMRTTFNHGLQLLASGDFGYALAHFEGVRPPKPLRVYINVSAAPAQLRRGCYSAVIEAMEAWNKALPDVVSFEATSDEDLANVNLIYDYDVVANDTANPAAAGQPPAVRRVCGITNTQMPCAGHEVDRSALVRIAIFQGGLGTPPHGRHSWLHVAAHELGHVLGLDESGSNADIMGPDLHSGEASIAPTADDAARVKQIIDAADRFAALARAKTKIEVPAAWNAKPAGAPEPPRTGAKPPAARLEPADTSPKPGEQAPAFEGKTADGKTIRLADYQGKVLLVDFWATWCGPCMADLPNLKALLERYRDKGLEVVAVSLDSDAAKLKATMTDKGMWWPSLFDGQGWGNAIAGQFNVKAIPQALLIGKEGVIVRREYRATSFEEDIRKLLEL